MKNLYIVLFASLFLLACKEQQNIENENQQTEKAQIQVSLPDKAEEIVYSYKKDSLPDSCQSDSEIVCAMENAVKCALSPTQKYCDKQSMPDFIFYDDAMFEGDGVTGRPTEQSFQLVRLKPIDSSTIEVLTKGHCNSNWFGACEGNVIYVLSNKTGKWQVKEIYAIEKIK